MKSGMAGVPTTPDLYVGFTVKAPWPGTQYIKSIRSKAAGPPPIPRSASGSTTSMDPAHAANAHRQCVQKAFTDPLSALCERANKLCEANDAVPRCARRSPRPA